MSMPCPKCGALYSWDGTRCCRRECRFGSTEPPIVRELKALPTHPVASLNDLFTKRISGPIVGISIDDLIDALRVVASMECSLDKRVMACGITDSGMIHVQTGEWPGPTAG